VSGISKGGAWTIDELAEQAAHFADHPLNVVSPLMAASDD
jgi:hypothetical protein